ncbi:MAG: VCBS repeat-containing protein [Planctomycetales bacterium]|nr:VCBS repeat-containing protein [Planctomycetales bacterium]
MAWRRFTTFLFLGVLTLCASSGCHKPSAKFSVARPVPSEDLKSGPSLDSAPAVSPSTQVVPKIATQVIASDVLPELLHVRPQESRWDTESFSEAASAQLKQLAKRLHERHNESSQTSAIDFLITDSFQSTSLIPGDSKISFDVLGTAVRSSSGQIDTLSHVKLSERIAQLQSHFGPRAEFDFHFKIVRVTADEDAIRTTVYVELGIAFSDSAKLVQQSSVWNCEWTRQLDSPKLQSLVVEQWQQVESPNRLFTDATATLLDANECYKNQLIYGADHWRQTLDWRFGMEIAGPHGLAVADVNNDGLDDIYYCETGGLPNRLFLQQPDGTVKDYSSACGLDFLEPTHSSLFVDLDNDGDQDAVLAVGRFVLWFANDGQAHFVQQGIFQSPSMLRSMAAADYDNDGDVDIYACGYFPRESIGDGVGLGRPLPYHDANNGVPNFLLQNNGSGSLQDATSTVGLNQNNQRFSFAACWEDYDNDGDQDLYVANDFGRNNLYRNDQGYFVDVAADANVEDVSAGMSAAWGDFDRDGRMDAYVGNMFSSAGNRITYQRRFHSSASNDVKTQYQRHARGNTLFRNTGEGMFDDVSLSANVNMGRWSWGCNFADINNDGWEDLLVGNGMVTSQGDPDDL